MNNDKEKTQYYNREALSHAAAEMLRIGRGGSSKLASAAGLCTVIGEDEPFCNHTYKAALGLMRSWPKYSGTVGYPVPAPDGTSPVTWFFAMAHEERLLEGKYGGLRRELALHVGEGLVKVVQRVGLNEKIPAIWGEPVPSSFANDIKTITDTMREA